MNHSQLASSPYNPFNLAKDSTQQIQSLRKKKGPNYSMNLGASQGDAFFKNGINM